MDTYLFLFKKINLILKTYCTMYNIISFNNMT